ncbi:MAG: hypothetical protein P8Z50_07245, partial [candidate division WOR-3 bacterium]
VILIGLWLVTNLPIKDALVDFPYFNLSAMCTLVLLFLAIIATINLIKNLIEATYSRKNSVNENT